MFNKFSGRSRIRRIAAIAGVAIIASGLLVAGNQGSADAASVKVGCGKTTAPWFFNGQAHYFKKAPFIPQNAIPCTRAQIAAAGGNSSFVVPVVNPAPPPVVQPPAVYWPVQPYVAPVYPEAVMINQQLNNEALALYKRFDSRTLRSSGTAFCPKFFVEAAPNSLECRRIGLEEFTNVYKAQPQPERARLLAVHRVFS